MAHVDAFALAGRPPTAAEQAHLDACVACRLQWKWIQPVLDDFPVAPDLPSPPLPDDRYEDLGPLGRGGMGEVRLVYDRRLAREVALKVLPLDTDPERAARFVREAQVTATLQHPGVAPVFDRGELPDGRAWYTMRRVPGETFAAVLGARERVAPAEDPATRHLLEILARVAETVGYAHRRGVLHRDLKPANIAVGELGEVVVLDWGLARGGRDGPAAGEETLDGTVAGTPGWMAPEQARGEVDRIGPQADVYALGVMLWEVLTGTPLRPPGGEGQLALACAGTLPTIPATIPAELRALLEGALAPTPDGRPADGSAFATVLRAWLGGAWRRERAVAHLVAAEQDRARAATLRAEAGMREARARDALVGVRPSDPIERKRPAWAEEDEARRLRVEAEEAEQGMVEHLRAARTEAPDLSEASERLADHYVARLADAEARRDEVRLGFYARRLAEVHPLRHHAWADAAGAVVITSDPPGADVVARRYEPHDRRLEPGAPRPLGGTPLEAALPAGSWLLELRHGDRVQPVPVVVERGVVTHFVRPGGGAVPVSVALPLDPAEVLVPAGWFIAGGDPEAVGSLPRERLWADAFVITRHPVTNAEFLAFLDDLVANGRGDEALGWAPRERAGTFGEAGALIYGRTPDGRFTLVPDAEGDLWHRDWPVLNVSLDGARAYAAWRAAREGLPWRLPMELEWEKAARGADGRAFPMGDFLDPTWANVREASVGRPLPAAVGAHPLDVSPYGVAGLAGNVRDRCVDLLRPEGPRRDGGIVWVGFESGEGSRTLKGGSFGDVLGIARAAARTGVAPAVRGGRLGFRLVRSV